MIEIRNINHSLGGNEVLKDVNLTVKSGSVMGLVGINGAGKSTLLRIVSGVYAPCGGEVLLDGKSVLNEETRKELFFLPDDPYYTMHTTGMALFEMYKVFYPGIDGEKFKEYIKRYTEGIK